jgi:hypothetical protein
MRQQTKESIMSVRAKFKVEAVTRRSGEVFNVELWPVTSGSEENAQFYKWTPSGKIELQTINADAAAQFEVGGEYYIDFTRAE